jgi:hypothetical protein
MSEERNKEQIAVAIGTSSVDFLAQQFMAAMRDPNSAELRLFIQAAALYRFGVEAWNDALKRNAVH